jgi:hypothetical protein
LSPPGPPKAFDTKIPQATAKAQPAVTTIQPAFLAYDFSSDTDAHTPPPNKIKIAVPKYSPKNAEFIGFTLYLE